MVSRTNVILSVGGHFVLEFQYDPETFEVTPEMQEVFDWDGAFVVRSIHVFIISKYNG